MKIFYSYAPQDKLLAKQLQQQLAALEKSGLITNWDEDKILGGADLNERRQHLDTASIIVLLVSPDYIASPYYEGEAQRAMQRRTAGEAIVLPVLLRPTYGWQHMHFGMLKAVPRAGKAVTQFANRDQAMSEVAQEIITLAENFHAGTRQQSEDQRPTSSGSSKFNNQIQGNVGNIIQGDHLTITFNQ